MGANYEQYPFPKGKHPPGWLETTVGDVLFEIRSGYSSGKHNKAGAGIPHLRPMNVSPVGEIAMDDVRYVAPSAGSLRLAKDDVLFTNTSSTVWVGKTALVEKPGDWGFSNHMTRLRVADGMSPEFVARQLHYLCMSGYFAFHCKKHINQSSVAGKQLAEEVPFRLPPAKEQKRISAKLNRLLARERKLRQQLDELPGLIQQYRAAVLEAACTGRLVPTEAEIARKERRDFEPASVLLERILVERRAKWEADQLATMRAAGKEPKDDKWKEKFQMPAAPSTEDLPELPSGWAYASMAHVCEIQGGIQKQPKRRPRSNHYPFLRVANVQRGSLELTEIHQIELFERELETFQLRAGDLLIVEGNGSLTEIGRMAVWADQIPDCVHQNHIIRARPSAGFLSQYGTAYWNSPDGTSRVRNVARSTSGLYTLSVGKIESLPVPVPPLLEQARIVEEVERRFSAIARIEAQLLTSLEQVGQLRASLFHNAISGNLVSQSSNEEPAALLLEIIAAARKSRQENRKKEARKPVKKKIQTTTAKRELLEILDENAEGVTPDHLMAEAGYTAEEVPAFYKALRKVEKEIQEVRPERKVVILKRRQS